MQINRSLERLQTDRLDLIQVHAVGDIEELDLVTGPGGSLEAVVRARDEGWRVRSGSPARAFTSNRATTPEAFSVASEIMTGTGRLGAARSQGRWPARWRDGEHTTNHRPTRNTGYPADVPATKENESSWIFEPRLTCSNTLRRVQNPGFSLVAPAGDQC